MTVGLAVSGGSSKGAFAVGVAQRLRERFGVTIDLVAGTSTGAVLAPFVIGGQLDRAEELYTSFSTDDCFIRQDAVTALQRGFLLDTAPLRELLTRFYDAALFAAIERAAAAGRTMYLAAVNVDTRQLTYFHVGPPPRVAAGRVTIPVRSAAELVEAVLASASQPALMPLPTIGGRRYCDGGVRETAPIRVLVDNGATDVFAVVLTPEPTGAPEPVSSSLIGTAGRTLDLLLAEVVRDDIEEAMTAAAAVRHAALVRSRLRSALDGPTFARVDAVLTELSAQNPFAGITTARVHLIRPAAELIADALEFTRADMRRMVRLGLERVDALFPNGLPAPPAIA
jgi:NTE family protein